MPTLSLFRHAKSSWTDPMLRDFDRPLAPRGREAAPRMGAYMAGGAIVPDLVLCSTAVRARQTLELALEAMRDAPEVQYHDDLYHAGPKQMLSKLKALPQSCRHAMLVGHNPGMHALAHALIGAGEPEAMEALSAKYPTAALAVIEFDVPWPELAPGLGRLMRYMVPKRLPATAA